MSQCNEMRGRPELPFHEGRKVGRSDANPLKIVPKFYQNMPVLRQKLMGVASLLFAVPSL